MRVSLSAGVWGIPLSWCLGVSPSDGAWGYPPLLVYGVSPSDGVWEYPPLMVYGGNLSAGVWGHPLCWVSPSAGVGGHSPWTPVYVGIPPLMARGVIKRGYPYPSLNSLCFVNDSLSFICFILRTEKRR